MSSPRPASARLIVMRLTAVLVAMGASLVLTVAVLYLTVVRLDVPVELVAVVALMLVFMDMFEPILDRVG